MFIAISFRNWHKATARAEAAEGATKALDKPKQPARIFAERPDALLAHLGDPKVLTAMQVIPYYDKWVKVSGRVEFAACGSATLVLERGQRVNLSFQAGQEQLLRDVRRGQYLTAVCLIRWAGSHSRVALENCNVLRAGPLSVSLSRAS